MTDRVLRWGLLSTARINRALIPPLRASDRNRLVAVGSRSLEQAQAYAREWDIPRAHGSYEELLADPEVDVIYNPLPNSMHAEWTLRAAQVGKHVLCEKPLALSLEEVRALDEAARHYGVVITEAFMYRHHPQTHKIRQLVETGALGELKLIRGSFSFQLDQPTNVRWDPALGGGSVWDVGCYPISMARYILSREPLEAFAWSTTTPEGVDITLAGQLRFTGAQGQTVLAQIDSSFALPFRAQVEVVGTDATLYIPTPFKPGEREELLLTRHVPPDNPLETLVVEGPEQLYLGEVEDLAAAVLDGAAPLIPLLGSPGRDSYGNVATILALLESTRRGAPVALTA